jgi:histidyl-tRNA synthetase
LIGYNAPQHSDENKALPMSKPNKDARPTPRLPRGLRDIEAAELRQQQDMLAKIRAVYELYGFEPLETPAFEYTDALGKVLPDQDRPNAGVFSFQDAPEARGGKDVEEWMSLRYDLTAPLARYVAQNYQDMPKPFRRYAVGPVWRNEKPGPGRFRQFMQFDADTVGAESVAADAEMCMLAADTLEALGIKRGDYVIKVNNRKIIDGVLGSIGLLGPDNSGRRLVALRALDKLDKFEWSEIAKLLGEGRKDESGDYTDGAKLSANQIYDLKRFLEFSTRVAETYFPDAARFLDSDAKTAEQQYDQVRQGLSFLGGNLLTQEGIEELIAIHKLCASAGYVRLAHTDLPDVVRADPSVIRGLEYYTGPVFEAELTFEVKDEKGRPVRFGSVGGGGRYDDLVARFTGQKVPATGFSMGVSRLQAALALLGSAKTASDGPVIVTVMEKERIADYQKMVQALRTAGIRAELYLGNPKKFGKQLEYADKRGSPCVVIQGSDERAKGEVTLKDLVEGAKAAAAISDNKEWKEARPAQISVKEADLVAEVRKILARHTA